MEAEIINFDTVDNIADEEIQSCLSLSHPRSFFLFAGAGSGKTRSLINALENIKEQHSRALKLKGQKVGVITYTNAACDEINDRLEYNALFHVSTIHSFVWSLIKGFDQDIKKWLEANLKIEIADLKEKQDKGRTQTQASIDRARKIESKTKRLEQLKEIKKFTYNPNGDNVGKDSLNHSEVIQICSDFLITKPTMQNLLVTRFPLLLVDESQDTNKHLMEAFFKVQSKHAERFALGLLGDMMQRIYADGKDRLGEDLPETWAKPAKKMNHRSAARIVTLINKIRVNIDGQSQTPRLDRGKGFVRLFILPSHTKNKSQAELIVTEFMADYTSDPSWFGSQQDIKTLILEHHMAAKRMGFLDMFEALNKVVKFQTGLRDGSLKEVRIFSNIMLPLIEAHQKDDKYTIAAIVKRHSPLVSKNAFKKVIDDPSKNIKKARDALNDVCSLWEDNNDPTLFEIINAVFKNNLFEIPESMIPILLRSDADQNNAFEAEDDNKDTIIDALETFLSGNFSQIKPYVEYINQTAQFDTHQGVKGREFPRVMVVIDDTEARGFMFKYEKLFGVSPLTETDIQNEKNGKDTSLLRTRRLFYVTCSRAEESLAIVAYTENPEELQSHVLKEGWFSEDEIQIGLG